MIGLTPVFLARTAVWATKAIAEWTVVLEDLELSEAEQAQWRERIKRQEWAVSEAERLLPDDDLVTAYQRSRGEADDAEAGALAAEIERRNLDL